MEKQTRVVLFGRAALALGYGDQGVRFAKTQDVDAILPTVEMGKIEADAQFWKAIELTNKSLDSSGLYLSHLFTDRQVALTHGWLSNIVAVPSGDYKFLRLFRPSGVDLILTKMMRFDREDVGDIGFILEQERIPTATLERAFLDVAPLEIPEMQAIFLRMQPVVREMAAEWESGRAREGRSSSSSYRLDPDWWSKLTQIAPEKRDIEKDRGIER